MRPSLSPIFFDLDGPILDVSRRHYHVYVRTILDLGGRPVSLDQYWGSKRRKISDRHILCESNLTGRESEYTQLKLARIESDEFLTYDTIVPGVREAILRIRERHNVVLVTLRNSEGALLQQLSRLSLTELFDCVLSGRPEGVEGCQIKRDLIKSKVREFSGAEWIIGDTETDILAGQLLGIRTAAVTNGIRAVEILCSLKPDRLLSSAAEFDPGY